MEINIIKNTKKDPKKKHVKGIKTFLKKKKTKHKEKSRKMSKLY